MAEKSEKQLVVGILAHVDSGKTTLSEAMLYRAGSIRRLGRVDNKDAFLDTDTLEKARGITIFSKQALLKTGRTGITLLDTPGHVDFSTETERTLQVLDYAVLVVSGTDGVQSHTETLWRLLRRYHIPTFVFLNKMDLPGPGKEALLRQLSRRLGEGFVDFGAPQAERDEALALCDERLMETMLDAGGLTAEDIIPAIARRHVFPCWFGVALQRENAGGLQGVDELLEGLDRYTRAAPALEAFGARVFKVSQDERGERLTWLRVTGGELKVKAQLTGEADGEPWAEKANQLRLYSGAKYTLAEAIGPGQVCAVTGLTKAQPRHRTRGRAGQRPPGAGTGAELPGAVCPRARMSMPHWASSTVWKRKNRSSTSSGTRRWARYTSSSWARFSSRCSRACWPSGTGWTWSSTPAAYYIRRRSPRPSRAWAIMSRCATMPRCI